MRLGIQQRLLPHFRAPLFDAIAEKNNGPVEVFSGLPQPEEGIQRADGLRHAKWRITHNRCFTVGSQKAYWQEQFGHWLDEFKPDVLAVESNPRILSNYPGFRRARSLGIPIVGWGIGVMGDARDRGLYGAFMRRYFRQFDGMIAYGSKGAEDFRQLGVDPDRVFIARNSVSNVEADKLLKDTDQARALVKTYRDHICLKQAPTVLFLGRMIPEKEISALFDAIRIVKAPCQLLLVGDGPLREELEKEAEEKGIDARFVGHLAGRDLVLAILASDVCVLPGRGGLAIQEVMAAGRPVIAGIADGTQDDLIRNGITGFNIVEPSAESLAKLLDECFSMPESLHKMGVSARKLILREHNMELAVDSVLSAIHSILQR